MSEVILSENLRYWRAERPDEWKMDDFIREADKLELLLARCKEAIVEAGYEDYDHGLMDKIESSI